MLNIKNMALITMMLMAPLGHAAIVNADADGKANGTIERSVNTDDLSFGLVAFHVDVAGMVSISSNVDVDVDWELSVWSGSTGDYTRKEPEDALSGIGSGSDPSLALDLLIGDYLLVIGVWGYNPGDVDLEYFQDGIFFVEDPADVPADWSVTIVTPTEVPIPAALPLFLSSLAGLSLFRRKQKQR